MSMQYSNDPFFDDEYVSEEQFAHDEGFYIDEDGHWVEMDNEMLMELYFPVYHEDDVDHDADDECMDDKGSYVDDDEPRLAEDGLLW